MITGDPKMALNSPGVEVQVIDESFYVPAEPGTRPLIIVTSQENKSNASGTGIAVGTLKANAGKPYLITSQRELSDTFGTPLFYKDSSQNPIHGGELNEYGLQAAYSYLGVSNSAYIVRADLDTKQMIPVATPPNANPADGTYWLDVQNTRFGIFEWNGSAVTVKGGQQFTNVIPTVITDANKIDTVSGSPKSSIGKIGDYAVVCISTLNKIYYKNRDNTWVLVGTPEWNRSWPTIAGSKVNPSTINNKMSFFINGTEITLGWVAGDPEPVDLVAVKTAINALNDSGDLRGITANIIEGHLEIYSDGAVDSPQRDSTLSNEIVIASGEGALVAATESDSILGIKIGTYFGTALQISPHTSVPRFKRKDLLGASTTGRPSGSVWIKTTDVNLGARWRVKEWSSRISDWAPTAAPVYASNQEAIFKLDRTGGGKNIAAGAIFVQFDVGEDFGTDDTPRIATFKLYRRELPDPTTITSDVITATTFAPTVGPDVIFNIAVSIPGSSSLTSDYLVHFRATGTNGDAAALASAINSKSIPNLIASVDTRNRLVIKHELGGEIRFKDGIQYTQSGDLIGDSEFIIDTEYQITTLGNTDWHVIGVPLSVTPVVGTIFTAKATGDTVSPDPTSTGHAKVVIEVASPMSRIYHVYDVDTGGGTANFYNTPAQIGTIYKGHAGTALDPYTDDVVNNYDMPGDTLHDYMASNWKPLKYTASDSPPNVIAEDGTLWFDPVLTEADIMIHNGITWVGYLYDGSGSPQAASPYYVSTEEERTDPYGPIVSATKPSLQQSGRQLRDGDLWIDSGDTENYPAIYRYDFFNLKWVAIDVTDQTTENGILFADARFNTEGSNSDEMGSIQDLLSSNFLDFDAPDPALYPRGMLLFNTRRSGNNVKRFVRDYVDVNADNFRYNGDANHTVTTSNGQTMGDYYPHRWVNESGNAADGRGLFGRKAQRKVVVKHLKALVDTNADLREQEIRTFNLIACPGYVELISNMINLNIDRKQTAFVIGDTPFRLTNDATTLNNWGSHANTSAVDNGEEALVTYDEYLGVYYPSGYTTDNYGNNIVVPASHMVLRTIALSDNVSYPWFAPAGTRRGHVNNATSIGYVNAIDGEWKAISLNEGQRDTLYSVAINPITFITGSGIVIFGQKTRAANASALDRVNVARLVVYLRGQLSKLAKPYIFEPNDKITRDELKAGAESIMLELVGQRALYDYLVVCDDSNNTPARIDRNELYLDIAIEPVKAVEFIYIPLRLKNTGEIAGLK